MGTFGSPLLLSGKVPPSESEKLRKENSQLHDRNEDLEQQLLEAKSQRDKAMRAIQALQHSLQPQFLALRAIFGEIEAAGLTSDSATTSSTSSPNPANPANPGGVDPRWQSYKERFPGVAAKVIDALLLHREMNTTELVTFVGCHYNTLSAALVLLSKAGAVTKDGGRGGKYKLQS
jgi:hypothetical protein